jgi:hypothetical protein
MIGAGMSAMVLFLCCVFGVARRRKRLALEAAKNATITEGDVETMSPFEKWQAHEDAKKQGIMSPVMTKHEKREMDGETTTITYDEYGAQKAGELPEFMNAAKVMGSSAPAPAPAPAPVPVRRPPPPLPRRAETTTTTTTTTSTGAGRTSASIDLIPAIGGGNATRRSTKQVRVCVSLFISVFISLAPH